VFQNVLSRAKASVDHQRSISNGFRSPIASTSFRHSPIAPAAVVRGAVRGSELAAEKLIVTFLALLE
jgi:hypothetical protein